MNPITFDTLTRRASLIAASAAGIAALASPIASKSKKKRKKKDDVNKLCKTQIEACLAFYEMPSSRACCAFFGSCDIAGFYECLRAN